MEYFYDTCALLNLQEEAFKSHFYVSNITLKELENIKTSATKDQETKYKARHLVNLLSQNEDKYDIVSYQSAWDKAIELNPLLTDNNDSKILLCAAQVVNNSITFATSDLCCKAIASALKINSEYLPEQEPSDDYKGFKEVTYNNDDEVTQIYTDLYEENNKFDMLVNQYLIIKDNNDVIIDRYKYTTEGFIEIPYTSFDSRMFGKVKPKDGYQVCLMDSLKNNKITLVRGPAGTGKSYISLGYLFSQLDKHNIEKIVIFCNTIATAGSAKLGFYPGSRTEKLLDSQIGNFLSSKLGDKVEVERLIADGELELLPMSDIRGYDTTGMKAGVYITEAQNLDITLMKLALQRIGEDSICILDGDTDTQVDSPLYSGRNNGMKRVSEIFRGDPAYGEVELQQIYRSHIAELAELL